ncbi:MAG: hypothetical protein ACXAC7_12865 [Candidatus Hodarchaeales archaeon]|jgi:hypothetical protein
MDLENEEQISKTKNIAIRGIDARMYEIFSRKIQAMGMQMGDAFNKIMQEILKNIDEVFPEIDASTLQSTDFLPTISIYKQEEVSISKNDLIEAESRLSINKIEKLIFKEDISKEEFKRYIISIVGCKTLLIPKKVPKLLVLSKISDIERIEYY